MIIPIGATVRINKPGYYFHGKKVVVVDLPTCEIGGMDLGELIAFESVDFWGDVAEHVISREWVVFVSAPVVPLRRMVAPKPDDEGGGRDLPLFGTAAE